MIFKTLFGLYSLVMMWKLKKSLFINMNVFLWLT